jgi:hypothetical protein
MPRIGRTLAVAGLIAAALAKPALADPPKFQVDPLWGVPMPNNWIIGQTGGIYVDAQDHVWLNQRPGTLTDREKRGTNKAINVKCVPAPSVIEFDQNGKVGRAGRPGAGLRLAKNRHGIFVDRNNFVWVGGNDPRTDRFSNSLATGSSSCRSASRARCRDRPIPRGSRPADRWSILRPMSCSWRTAMATSASSCSMRRPAPQAPLGRLRQGADRPAGHLSKARAAVQQPGALSD